jgi:hypothetical protein
MDAAEDPKTVPFPLELTKGDVIEDPPQAPPLGINTAGGGGSVDKIRDILFGAQMRAYDKRFGRVEERLLKEAAALREEARQRFDSLEAYIKRELEALGDRLAAEQHERTEAVKDLSRELREAAQALEKRLAQVGEQSAKNDRERRQQLLEQSKDLGEEIRQNYKELSATLERKVEELRADKTDRSALASLFMEVALRLNSEFHLPGPEELGNA